MIVLPDSVDLEGILEIAKKSGIAHNDYDIDTKNALKTTFNFVGGNKMNGRLCRISFRFKDSKNRSILIFFTTLKNVLSEKEVELLLTQLRLNES